MKNAFFQNNWLFDGLLGIGFGIWIGREFQLFANSGEYIFSKILTASLIGAISYSLALLIGFLLNKKLQKIPSWVWISILGAIFFAFNKYIIWYLIENWNYGKSDGFFSYILELFPKLAGSFILISIISMIPLFLFFLTVRVVFYYFRDVNEKFSKS